MLELDADYPTIRPATTTPTTKEYLLIRRTAVSITATVVEQNDELDHAP
jgi:hypothetical protein